VVESYISRALEIRLLRNLHGGMAANLNTAYRNCSGDVICLIDADDTFLACKIEAVVNAFQAHPRDGFAIHRASLVDHQGRARGIYPLLSALPSGNCMQTTYENSVILMGLPPLMTGLRAVDAALAIWRLHNSNDQNSTLITTRRLERELKIMDSLWLEQKHYLEGVDAAVALSRPPVDRNPLYLKMNYIRHRLNNDSAIRQAYNDLCRYGLRDEFEDGSVLATLQSSSQSTL
jgi:glycosyltransferase involved in cell wall biosynthesis